MTLSTRITSICSVESEQIARVHQIKSRRISPDHRTGSVRITTTHITTPDQVRSEYHTSGAVINRHNSLHSLSYRFSPPKLWARHMTLKFTLCPLLSFDLDHIKIPALEIRSLSSFWQKTRNHSDTMKESDRLLPYKPQPYPHSHATRTRCTHTNIYIYIYVRWATCYVSITENTSSLFCYLFLSGLYDGAQRISQTPLS